MSSQVDVVVINLGDILMAQCNKKMDELLKWEFPDGKMEEGEDLKEALQREFKEELNLCITIGAVLTPVKYEFIKTGFLPYKVLLDLNYSVYFCNR